MLISKLPKMWIFCYFIEYVLLVIAHNDTCCVEQNWFVQNEICKCGINKNTRLQNENCIWKTIEVVRRLKKWMENLNQDKKDMWIQHSSTKTDMDN